MGALRFLRRNAATVVAGLLSLVALVASVAFVIAGGAQPGTRLYARVHDADGREWYLPLDEDATLVVDSSLGHNVSRVSGGQVRMAEADCPKQSCLAQAPVSQPSQQIICLPHKLWVEVVGADDAAAGEGASADASRVRWADGDPGSGAGSSGVDVVAS